MRNLKEILSLVGIDFSNGQAEIGDIVFDSRKATLDSLFVALKGHVSDGHQFLSQAFQQGCRFAIIEDDILLPEGMIGIKVKDSRLTLADLACTWYHHPSKELKLVGITGTNGKTTTTTLLHQLCTELGAKSGLISTVVNKIGTESHPSTHTTPDPLALNALLRLMVDEECTHCFMEVSSHAVHQHRIHGLHFTGGVFTNITHDHLDYHKTFAEYIKAKKSFFDALVPGSFALTNRDDKNGQVMVQNTAAKTCTYALNSLADFKGIILENILSGLVLKINGVEVHTRLIGAFNAYNLLAVYGVGILLGFESIDLLAILSNLESVEGRFQFFTSQKGVTVVVDYAHTPDALENVLKTISLLRERNQKVITLVGCGGDRDRTKRPEMASIAQKMSSQVILTSDNPRTENPSEIIKEMESGLDSTSSIPVLSIEDRKQAILTASLLASAGDVVLIAGKGHEKYQEILGVKHPFDDFQIAHGIFNKIL